MNRAPSITLYGTPPSGHAHRVEVLLKLLGLPYSYVTATVDVRQTPEFLALNPLGQIPVLQDDEAVVCDSTAILIYLIEKYAPDSPWLPRDPKTRAEVQRWLSIASAEVRFGPATARAVSQWNMAGNLDSAKAIAARLFNFMEGHLAGRLFLAAPHPTLADLACYAYIAHAPEGGIDLSPYPHIQAWLGRVAAIPGFTDMAPLPLPAQ
ncbi:glutathione S-transferase [Zoogloea sp.]|uniref:glutathione S-transferase family protein n=1 Tax=Zoogloea sp. TaxID=49181 RepID=UPI001416011E|nr:MAG: glutathione S-transferase [Zoogloea sp.]